MSNWYNLLISILLLLLCGLCLVDIVIQYHFVGGYLPLEEQIVPFLYSYYNQSVTTLLVSTAFGFHGLLFMSRFLTKAVTVLAPKHLIAFLFLAISFWITAFNNCQNPIFEFKTLYFVALGISVVILVILASVSFRKRNILNEALLDDHQAF